MQGEQVVAIDGGAADADQHLARAGPRLGEPDSEFGLLQAAVLAQDDGFHLPVNRGLRFSRNARLPSAKSSHTFARSISSLSLMTASCRV